MCGNGGRCIALFAHHLGIGGMRKRFIGVDGPHTAELLRVEGPEGEIRLGMIDVRRVEVHPEYLFLDTGSPHYVEFVESVRGVDVAGRGAAIRHSAAFAARGIRVFPVSPALLKPLLVKSVRWSEELSIAMESRGFDGRVPRTCSQPLRLRPVDVLFPILSCALFLALFFLLGR